MAQQAHLYALHLADCPSYSAALGHDPLTLPANEALLPELRGRFAREVKRGLFEAYLRPHRTMIKLVSNSISSSSAPGGEGIQFTPSPKGHHVLAYNSSRIHLLDVRGADVEVKRELKILRRPAATCVDDAGSTLAVLLTEMQVDMYDLGQSPPKRTQSIALDHPPRAIAMSPCGSVLAAAYDGGIEVSTVEAGTTVQTNRRAVKCDAVDALAFSFDGTQILGTTVSCPQPNTVILTAPYYDHPGASSTADESIGNKSALWTTSILFPNTSRDCSHAVFLQPGREEEARWTFTYDRSFETFRAVRIGDLRNGTTYFTGPIPSPTSQVKLIPCTLPAASYHGDLVSAAFQRKEIWLYGVPQDVDAVPDPGTRHHGHDSIQGSNGPRRRNSGPWARSRSRGQQGDRPETARLSPWQALCDKSSNTFVGGSKVAELKGVTTVKWIVDSDKHLVRERLLVAARGAMPARPVTEEDGIDFEDGGRITLLDFDYRATNGQVREVVVQVGAREPETLEEQHRDMATEVAMVRRRTVAQKRASRVAMMRVATTASGPPPQPRTHKTWPEQMNEADDDPLVPRLVAGAGPAPMRRPQEAPAGEEAETEESMVEEQEALDAPYAHASPRSGTTLRRAATAAAVNRRLHTTTTTGQYEYRRADGRPEHPHESDADNWVPPPPPYQEEDPGDTPVFLRHAFPPAATPEEDQAQADKKKHQSHQTPVPPVPSLPLMASVPQTTQPALPAAPQPAPPRTSPSRYLDGDNIYDASPPGSPAPAAPSLASPPGPPPPSSSGLAQTQPTQPAVPRVMGTAAGPAESAPPGAPRSNEAMAMSFPPPPRPDQLASLKNRRDSAPRRLSGASNFPRASLDKRASGDFTDRRSSLPPPLSHQPSVFPTRQQLHRPLSRPPSEGVSPEERPLIISTPDGVQGALDPREQHNGRRAETVILSPVPRRPRPHTQPAVLRPNLDRLETIHSIASSHSGTRSEQAEPAPHAQQQQAPRSVTLMADAKRRRLTGRTRRSKGKERAKGRGRGDDLGSASSAARIDVAPLSRASLVFGPRTEQQGARGQVEKGKGGHKCVVM